MSRFLKFIRPVYLGEPLPTPLPVVEVEVDDAAVQRTLFALFKQWGRPGIELSPHAAESALPIASTKIGGCPDLPPDFMWPFFTDPKSGERHALSFLMQLNLAEASVHDPLHEFPPTGLILFFGDLQAERSGYGPWDAGCGRVFYWKDTTSLRRGSFPDALPPAYRYAECAVALSPALIPPAELDLDEEQRETLLHTQTEEGFDLFGPSYTTARAAWRGYADPYHSNASYLLGWPDIIEDEMRFACAECAHRLGRGQKTLEESTDEELDAMYEASHDWVLLLQLTGCPTCGKGTLLLPHDAHLYFWIHRNDLAARDFSRVWLMRQRYGNSCGPW